MQFQFPFQTANLHCMNYSRHWPLYKKRKILEWIIKSAFFDGKRLKIIRLLPICDKVNEFPMLPSLYFLLGQCSFMKKYQNKKDFLSRYYRKTIRNDSFLECCINIADSDNKSLFRRKLYFLNKIQCKIMKIIEFFPY
jgi:hypothetical protein